MHRVHMSGAISAMMINILLVVIIAAAVAILLLRTEPDAVNKKLASAPPPAQKKAAVSRSPAVAPAIGKSDQEIDAIKSQLDQEERRLEELREQEELVEKIRREEAERNTENASAKPVEIQTARIDVKAGAGTNIYSVANVSGTKQAAVEQNTDNSESKKPKRRLITPMGFPE